MASASPVFEQIAADAWRETARLAVGALSHRPGELGEAGRTLARTLDLSAPLPRGVEALAQYLAERVPAAVRRNPYGEAAIAMGALLRDRGVQDVLVYGTAASLDRGSQVGELHLASQATSPGGMVHDFDNHAIDAQFAELHAQPGTRLRSRVVNVRSPLDEFDRDIDRLRTEGHHLVEMELAGLLRGLGGGGARIAALHVVSDVPQSADTLEGFSPTRAERALGVAVDVWVRTFGIVEL